MSAPPSGIITFSSDFGTRDGYVGTVKGVISALAPQATVIDISHDIEPWCISDAAWILFNSCRYFPAGTIHMMIVDPGVGSKQRRILLTNGAHTFLGPDNGVFTWLYSSTEYGSVHQSIDLLPWEAYELTSSSLWLSSVSSTFHARDLFAPVAARLANGLSPGQVGERVSLESLDRISLGLAECESEFIGQVVFVDRFGNLITNIPSEKLQRGWVVVVGDETVEVGESYAGVDKGNLVALKGSHGFLEIAVNQGRADSRLQTKTGAVIKVVQN